VTEFKRSNVTSPRTIGRVGPTLRERRKDETRAEIVTAALDLFERKGFEATTVEDIAAAVGMSARTFFRYFESKTAVVLHSKQEHEAQHKEMLVQALLARPKRETPGKAMAAVLRAQLQGIVDDDHQGLRKLRIVLGEPSLRTLAQSSFHDHRPELAAAFAARLRREPDDLAPRVLAAAFTEIIWVVLERWVELGGDRAMLPDMIDEAFASLEHGL
jgi:AcrR family transcriptional regulator